MGMSVGSVYLPLYRCLPERCKHCFFAAKLLLLLQCIVERRFHAMLRLGNLRGRIGVINGDGTDKVGGRMDEDKRPNGRWMRAVSFASLHRVLHTVAESRDGLRVHELNSVIAERGVRITGNGAAPAPTTLYHYRNTLLRLDILRRQGQCLIVNHEDDQVQVLLSQAAPSGTELDAPARDAFAALVLRNEDCRARFFDLFIPDARAIGVNTFRARGRSVTWRRIYEGQHAGTVLLVGDSGGGESRTLRLYSPSDVQSTLYGVRYWARDELRLIDEFYREGVGAVMYPVLPLTGDGPCDVAREIPRDMSGASDWTTLSLLDLKVRCCQQKRRPVQNLNDKISWLAHEYVGKIVLIPTSRDQATLTARSEKREEFELRGYFRDGRGRYISHIRLHKSVFATLSRC